MSYIDTLKQTIGKIKETAKEIPNIAIDAVKSITRNKAGRLGLIGLGVLKLAGCSSGDEMTDPNKKADDEFFNGKPNPAMLKVTTEEGKEVNYEKIIKTELDKCTNLEGANNGETTKGFNNNELFFTSDYNGRYSTDYRIWKATKNPENGECTQEKMTTLDVTNFSQLSPKVYKNKLYFVSSTAEYPYCNFYESENNNGLQTPQEIDDIFSKLGGCPERLQVKGDRMYFAIGGGT